MTRVSALKNLGPASERWLAEIGVGSAEELARLGAVEAYRRLRFAHGAQVTLNALYAMDAAIAGLDWRELPAERKDALRREAGLEEAAG